MEFIFLISKQHIAESYLFYVIYVLMLYMKIVNNMLYNVGTVRIHPWSVYLDCVVGKVSLLTSFKANINSLPTYFSQASDHCFCRLLFTSASVTCKAIDSHNLSYLLRSGNLASENLILYAICYPLTHPFW